MDRRPSRQTIISNSPNKRNNHRHISTRQYVKNRLSNWGNDMLEFLELIDKKLSKTGKLSFQNYDKPRYILDPGARGYRSVSAANIPSALIEPFFGDHAGDAQSAKSGKDDLAAAIVSVAANQLTIS